jgi:hypothetical protein
MKVGLLFIFSIALAMGYLSLIAHSWADGQPSEPNRAPAQNQETAKQ